MPNWCYNNLTLSHKEPEMIVKALADFNSGYSFTTTWDIEHWGTTSDVGNSDDIIEECEHTIFISFDSPWKPPIDKYTRLEEQGFTVDGYYYDLEGNSYCGRFTDGFDDYYDIEGDSNWVVNNIPSEIDDMFGITSVMADWEAL